MLVYLAGSRHTPKTNDIVRNRLLSYFYCLDADKSCLAYWLNNRVEDGGNLFIDSGAYSAWSKGVHIDLENYGEFILRMEDKLSVHANLDVIGDPIATWENQRMLEAMGLEPMPIYHYGEDIKWLKRYLDKYEYIGLGGMVPISKKDLVEWLDNVFSNYLCDCNGSPRVQVHGFGLTDFDLMLRYPFYSVDSTTWLIYGSHGAMMMPKTKDGQFDYTQAPYQIVMFPTGKRERNKHIACLTPNLHRKVKEYIYGKGYRIGRTCSRQVDEDYVLQPDEKEVRAPRHKTGRWVQRIIAHGLATHYNYRDMINAEYFNDLMDNYPEWPTTFKQHYLFRNIQC